MDVAERRARRVTGLAWLEGRTRRAIGKPDPEELAHLDWARELTACLAAAWRRGETAVILGRRLDPPAVYGGCR